MMVEGYCAAQETAPGEWQGLYFQLHPSPSGFEHHILRFSTNTRYPFKEQAVEEMEAAVERLNQASPGDGADVKEDEGICQAS